MEMFWMWVLAALGLAAAAAIGAFGKDLYETSKRYLQNRFKKTDSAQDTIQDAPAHEPMFRFDGDFKSKELGLHENAAPGPLLHVRKDADVDKLIAKGNRQEGTPPKH